MFTTCAQLKPKKNIKEWKLELLIDDMIVPDEWKTNPWSLVGEGFEIVRVEKKEEFNAMLTSAEIGHE